MLLFTLNLLMKDVLYRASMSSHMFESRFEQMLFIGRIPYPKNNLLCGSLRKERKANTLSSFRVELNTLHSLYYNIL